MMHIDKIGFDKNIDIEKESDDNHEYIYII